MTARAEEIVDRAMGGEKPLRLAGRFEPAHLALPLASRLMGKLRAIVQPLVLAMFDAGQDLFAGRAVALEFVGDDHLWHVA